MKSASFLFITLNFFYIFFTACSQHSVISTTSDVRGDLNTNKQINVNLLFELDTTDKKIKVAGQTNLPDETNLLVSVEGEKLSYKGGDTVKVKNGKFFSESFSDNHHGLPDGRYVVSVTMPIAPTQPKSVQAIIGSNGENLTGEFVKESALGGKNVAARQVVDISDAGITPSLESSQKAASTEYKKALAVYKELLNLLGQGREMETLRNVEIPNALKNCGDRMRQLQKKLKALELQAESLNGKPKISLTTAAIAMKLCITCSDSAMENCNRAEKSLQDAQSLFKEAGIK